MKTRNVPTPNTGEPDGLAIDGRPVPYLSGVLPKDFARRLNRLKKASGLSWNDFADALAWIRRACTGGATAPSPAAEPSTPL